MIMTRNRLLPGGHHLSEGVAEGRLRLQMTGRAEPIRLLVENATTANKHLASSGRPTHTQPDEN